MFWRDLLVNVVANLVSNIIFLIGTPIGIYLAYRVGLKKRRSHAVSQFRMALEWKPYSEDLGVDVLVREGVLEAVGVLVEVGVLVIVGVRVPVLILVAVGVGSATPFTTFGK